MQVLVVGGNTDMATAGTPAVAYSLLMDFTQATLAWQREQMPIGRVMPDAVILPDGTVAVFNGGESLLPGHGAAPLHARHGPCGTSVSCCPSNAPELADRRLLVRTACGWSSSVQPAARVSAGNYGIAGGNPGSGNAFNQGTYGARWVLPAVPLSHPDPLPVVHAE